MQQIYCNETWLKSVFLSWHKTQTVWSYAEAAFYIERECHRCCDEDVLFVHDLKNHLSEYEARSFEEANWDSSDLPHQAGAGEIVNKTSREVRAGSLSWGLGSPALWELCAENKCQN